MADYSSKPKAVRFAYFYSQHSVEGADMLKQWKSANQTESGHATKKALEMIQDIEKRVMGTTKEAEILARTAAKRAFLEERIELHALEVMGEHLRSSMSSQPRIKEFYAQFENYEVKRTN